MKTKRATAAPDLAPDVIAVLLAGWGAHPPTPCAFHGFSGGFLDVVTDAGAVWRQHATYLRQVARTWRWQPQWTGLDGTPRFYSEHLAAGGLWYDEP